MSEPSQKRRKVRDGKSSNAHTPTITDPRFANIQSDPRFQLPSKKKITVKVDKRFARILKDEDFARKAKVDRYGRPVEADSEQQRLKRRFEIESDEDDAADDDTVVQRELQRIEQTRDPLREGVFSESASEESSSEEEEDEDVLFETGGLAAQLDQQEVPVGEASSRLAAVNLDWDNIRAEDLMAVFSSFLPASDRLLKVAIYPSEFGKERMEREEMEGPPEEIFARKAGEEDSESGSDIQHDEEDIKKSIVKPDEGDEFDSAKLRQYQLERLRYFYAVLTFSSSAAAKAIYDTVDGTEYLSTANFFDLRFIPDETDFSLDKPREECEKIPDSYKPNEFVTDALQHSKVKLTWDADDVSRKEAQARAFRGGKQEIDENDLKAYLGTDSSEDEAGDAPATVSLASGKMFSKEQERQKMRALLGLGAEPVKVSKKEQGPVGDVQVTFSSGLSGNRDKKDSVFENQPEIEETTVEKYVRKERERKQKRKEKLKHTSEGGPAENDGDNKAAANANGQEMAKQAQDLGFDDPFFAAPENDKISASKMRKEERLKKQAERKAEEVTNAAKRAELELLMVDDKDTEVRHFDMNEIEKAEKRARRKGKHREKDRSLAEKEMVKDDFKVDTQDPRFASRLFENHEFAIDPTNPKFKDTAGMKALLDEGRKRRAKEDMRPEQKSGARLNKLSGDAFKSGDGEDVKKLVEKVKKKRHI